MPVKEDDILSMTTYVQWQFFKERRCDVHDILILVRRRLKADDVEGAREQYGRLPTGDLSILKEKGVTDRIRKGANAVLEQIARADSAIRRAERATNK